MRMVLGISTVLGVIGVISAFGLFYLGERVFRLDRAHIQTLMYLKLSVAGHLTIFLTRTRGPFWSIRPARILWAAVLGTQIVATLIAVYGLFMTPLGWGWAGFVWGYALLWFLLNDRVKLLAYRIFDPVKKAGAKPETRAESQPDAKGDAKTSAKPESKAEPQSGAKEEQKPEAKTDTKPDAKDEPKPEAKPEAKTEPKPDENAKPKPAAKAESKPETKAVDPKPQAKVEQKPDAKAEVEGKPAVEAKPEAKAKTTSDLTPQIATRAYELYEQQGHRDGQSVQNWKKAEQEIRKDQIMAEPKPEAKDKPRPAAKVEPKPETKVEPKPAAKTEPAPEVKAPATPDPTVVPPSAVKSEPKSELKADAKPTDNVEPKPDAKVENKPEPNAKPAAAVSPQLVKKVHEFYEQLGREDVRAVEESDQVKQKTPEEETKE
jgi:H+-transporting ATPase